MVEGETSLVFEPPFRQRVWRNVKRKRLDAEDEAAVHRDANLNGLPNDGDDLLGRQAGTANSADSARSAYSAHQPSTHAAVKYQHFTTLNAALYKCLAERNFGLAGRIFAILLRFEPSGAPAGTHVDIRNQNLWGVGAEILLRRDQSHPLSSETTSQNSADAISEAAPFATDKGFEEAKTFYERLILQYPKKHQASTVSSQRASDDRSIFTTSETVSAYDFYPIFFSLWIIQIQSRIQQRTKDLAEVHEQYQYDDEEAQAEINEVTVTGISEIRSIIDRMEEIVRLPPYDKNAELLRMQGELHLWIADVSSKSSSRAATVDQWRAQGIAYLKNLDAIPQG